jgi:peroxiredoxin
MIGMKVPNVTFKTREGDEPVGDDGGCPIGGDWVEKTTNDYFANKKVIVFSLPGAFTPTCSTYQLPGFEEHFEEFKARGIDEIYCISVNDSFVMNAWAQVAVSGGLKNVKVIPDGTGQFTRLMGMLVEKDNLGFGQRSWRYAMRVNNGVIDKFVEEPGREDNCGIDPYGETSPDNLLRSGW